MASVASNLSAGQRRLGGPAEPGGRGGFGRKWRIAKLTARVHFDGFRAKPWSYLLAVFWRLRGMRVRSRSRFARLIGRSPCAYALWMLRDEPHHMQPLATLPPAADILPVIDCRASAAGLDDTLDSLAAAGGLLDPLLLGADVVDGIRTIASPGEIARFVDGGKVWLCPLPCGDRLAPDALKAYAHSIAQSPGAVLHYADDDLVDSAGRRSAPHFKPEWNAELFEWHDYLSGACVLRLGAEEAASLPDEQWPEAAIRRLASSGARPVRVPFILHHRRWRPAVTIPAFSDIPQAASKPLVSVIIPTRNHCALLRTCMEGVRATRYPAVQVIVINNGSDDRETLAFLKSLKREGVKVIEAPGPFNYSALNNLAVRHADGDLLCFLNNDVEMLDGGWLDALVARAVRSDVGAVGARLLYPDRTIQHAGVCLGIGGGAAHAHRLLGEDDTGYFERARLPQRVSAVTAACLVVARDKFLAVGGFDETDFPVAFNDVDLCLKLNERGWHAFYEPRATLIHHESKSRGRDLTKLSRARLAGELAALKRKWGTDRCRDPFHHPNLSADCEQFVIAI